ncbi:MAG TPA: xanthine dehydrogenase family protein molybdopterin-binding subunit [Alphaproteobacteria bacterium]
MTERFGKTDGHLRLNGRGRVEDERLLTGRGRYTDDLRPKGAAHAYVLRSPHAHAVIASLDVSDAKAMPGVLAVLTGADVLADGLGAIPCVSLPRDIHGQVQKIIEPPHLALATDRVRFTGDAVALVVAESLAEAKDAAEQIMVDYDALPSVTDTAQAADADAPQIWPQAPGNRSFSYELGDAGAVAAAMARAAHVTKQRIVISRVAANPMEPRNAIGAYDAATERYTLHTGHQTPHQMRSVLAKFIFRIPEDRIRVISPDVGGGFGLKGGLFREQILVLWAAKRLGRPVAWQADRSESLLADDHGRDNVVDVELGLDANGKFLGLRVHSLASLGAYVALRGAHPPTNNLGSLSGVYVLPAIHARADGLFSNTAPTSSYRGAGRPEATYMLERIIDIAADEMGIDRLDIRRRNVIPAAAMPYKTGLLFTYDTGDFDRNMTMAAEAADWRGFAARRKAAKAAGKLRGMGVANCIEQAGGPYGAPWEEYADLRFGADGEITVLVGTMSNGQGHETIFADMVSDKLGVPRESVRVVQGDTDKVKMGRGSFGSRSMMTAGSALSLASDAVVAKATRVAAHELGVAADEVSFSDGLFSARGTNRVLRFGEVAQAATRPGLPAELAGGLDAGAIFKPPEPSYPNGCHICEIEIDPDTGEVNILRYVVADDVGVVLNHDMVVGQVCGGVAQGIGQALMEEVSYDRYSGQLLTGSFMDYAMPRAANMPYMEVLTNSVPSTSNTLGVKGAGEAGVIGSIPAVIGAVADALRPYGLNHIDMPATPEKIWRAINGLR